MKRLPIVFLCLAFSSPAFSAPLRQNASTRESLLARLDSGGTAPPLFHSLTPLLLDYIETVISKEKLADLYAASHTADFLRRLEAASGKDLIDLGNDMFSHYEDAAAIVDPPAWASFTAGAFLVHYRPGSAADKDRALISREIQTVKTSVVNALDLVELFNAAQSLLQSGSAETAGLIPVYLHASRRDPGAGKIKKDSQGSATLGATIVDTAGRLTFQIDILYYNALWLAVLEHEITHAVILLSTFDIPALTAKPLQGEADLRRAFFAGFRKISTFLQEGLGDWAFYYHGFQANWGLLPPPETILAGLKAKGRLLPLKELLAGDIRYAAKNRKAYSLEAAAFIEHLLKTQDKDKVKRWLLTNETNAAETFAGIFGISLEAAEKQMLGSTASASAFERGFDKRFDIMHARAEGLYFTLSAQPLEYTGDFRSSLTLWHFEKAFFIPRLEKSGVLDIGVGLGSKTAYGSWEVRYSLALPKTDVNGRNESIHIHNLEIHGRSFIWPCETLHAYLQLGIDIPVVFVKDGASYQGADFNAIYAGAGANLGGGVLFDLGRETFIAIGAIYRFQVFLYAYGEGKGRDINYLRTVTEGEMFGRLLRSSSFGLTVSLGFML